MIAVKTGRNILIGIFLLTSILITTIVYSAFSTQLQISGEAMVRSDNDIRITNVKVIEQTNNAYETYNNKYTKDITSMFVTLPSNSSITYEVEITDKVNVGYIIKSIDEISNTNSNVDIDIGLNQYDLVNANSIKKFNINFTNNTSEDQKSTLVLNYKFLENRFIVTFDANGGNVDTLTKEVAWGSNYGELPIPTRDGYTFKGWNGKNLLNLYDRKSGNLNGYGNSYRRDFDFNSYYIGLTMNNYYSKSNVLSALIDNNKWIILSKQDGYGVGFPLKVKSDFTYSISFDNYTTDKKIGIAFYDENGNYIDTTWETYGVKSFNTPNDCHIISFVLRPSSNKEVIYDYIQLEEGIESTKYEPYYVTNNIKVTQMKNHTLTAIWEEDN